MSLKSTTKILSLSGLLRLRKLWARRRKRVVFTNGVFDILHAGHIELLEKAKALGDVLVVGVNSDASVRRLGKGPDRPVNTLKARLRVLAALSCVDVVVPFSDDTPELLLSNLRPQTLVKGADYRPEQIAGLQHVGRLVLAPFKKGYSTTRLIQQIRRAKK